MAQNQSLAQALPAAEQVSTDTETMAEAQKAMSYDDLCEALLPLAAQWRALGVMLGISDDILNAIEGERDMAQNFLQKIISEWLYGTKGPHTKARIVEVLQKATVRLNALARKISENNDIPENFDEDKTASLRILWDNLSTAAHKYRPIGIQLLNDSGKVAEIETRVKDVGVNLEKALQEWFQQHGDPVPLQDVLSALRSGTVRRGALATTLEEKWRRTGLLPPPEENGDENEEEKAMEDTDDPLGIN